MNAHRPRDGHLLVLNRRTVALSWAGRRVIVEDPSSLSIMRGGSRVTSQTGILLTA